MASGQRESVFMRGLTRRPVILLCGTCLTILLALVYRQYLHVPFASPVQLEATPRNLFSAGNSPHPQCTLSNPDEWLKQGTSKNSAVVDKTGTDLVRHICELWLLKPYSGKRNLTSPSRVHYSQDHIGQSKIVDEIFKQSTNGFYIESGGGDGETFSNSLFFEKSRNWTGLLVEANPKLFRELLSKRRHAYTMNACLSPVSEPVALNFRVADVIGGLTDFMESGHLQRIKDERGKTNTIPVQCFPLVDILRALNVNHVNYFSLDIEGAELEVLQTFPFDKIRVDVLSIEYYIDGAVIGMRRKLRRLIDLMVGTYGYTVHSYTGGTDLILVKPH